jgi:Trypsin
LDEKLIESTDATSIESSVVTGEPKINVEITTKRSLHVKNCGERIGDDVPFIAILVHTNPNERKSAKQRKTLSKGVLVAENFVLATVSSIYHSEAFWTVSSVRLGDFVTWNRFAARDKSNSMEIAVEEIFYHKTQDLALIKLKHAVPFSDVIRPACLPQSDSYNFKHLKSHLCRRARNKSQADVSLETAVRR